MRVGLIGTGSSGVQSTPEIAKEAAHLYVFQRTPTYSYPATRGKIDQGLQTRFKQSPEEFRRQQRQTFFGVAGFGARSGCPAPPTGRSSTHRWRSASPSSMSWVSGAAQAWTRRGPRPGGQRGGGRAVPRDDPPDGQGPRRGREAVASRLSDRLQAAGARRRVLRHVQPRQRHACRPAAGADPGDHAHRHPDRAGRLRTGRDHLRHRLRRHDRGAQPDRHPRARRRVAARRVGRRTPHAARPADGRASPTCSRSPAPAARRCSPTWSSA